MKRMSRIAVSIGVLSLAIAGLYIHFSPDLPKKPFLAEISVVEPKSSTNEILAKNPSSHVSTDNPLSNTDAAAKQSRDEYVPDEILVMFSSAFTFQEAEEIVSEYGYELTSQVSKSAGVYLVSLPEGTDVISVQQKLLQHREIRVAEPNIIYYTQIIPDDPDFTSLWGLNNTGQNGGLADVDVNAPEAWERSTGSSNVIVAVIDTGVDYTHPDLVDNMWVNPNEVAGNGIDDDGNGYIDDIYGIDTVNDDTDPMDDHYHGTHVAGTIGARGNNADGVVGVNWDISIIACKFLNSGGSGSLSDAVECLDYLHDLKTNHNVDIVLSNNSWGGGGFSTALETAIALQNDADIIFVAAAGNSSNNNDISPSYPASYEGDNIVSVAAIDRSGNLANFSNYGATSVDIGAAGVDVYSTLPGNTYGSLSGTSMASPHVAGVLALIKADQAQLSMTQLITKLYEDAEPLASLNGLTLTGDQAKLDLIGADTDADGIPDFWEIQYGLDENDASDAVLDNDNDGLNNLQEYDNRTLPNSPDSDNDGLNDGDEVNLYATNPINDDTDQDGLSDGDEINTHSTNPLLLDSDDDGLNDGQEIVDYLTDPNSSDSDSDGLGDGFEVLYGFDPLQSIGEEALDSDSDGLNNLQEYQANTNPLSNDSDADGLTDFEEVNTYFTNPNLADSDSDGLIDFDEINSHSTDPNNADSDSDQMPDGFEVGAGLDPVVDDANQDPDLDGRNNLQEYIDGTNPLSPEVLDIEPNDSFDTAQIIDGFFTLNYSIDIGDETSNTSESIPHVTILGEGDGSYDFFEFTVTSAPSRAIFDIDYGYTSGTAGSMDSDLILFDPNGVELIYSDDASISSGEQGSESGLDSFFTYEFSQVGTYVLRVSQYYRSPIQNNANYTLHISLDAALVDADSDGMSDFWETSNGLDPNDPGDAALDLDSDGLSNLEEFNADTNPNIADTDSDGLNDGDEINVHSTDPKNSDSDSDGLTDGDEVNVHGTQPSNADSDSDGLTDGDEVNVHLTNPNLIDSDTDGLGDGYEITHGYDPTVLEDHANLDDDNDTLSNLEEFSLGTNPRLEDSDQDELTDPDEVSVYSSNPNSADTDSDGMPDGWEVSFALDLLINDADLDADLDSWSNLLEYQNGTDPTDASSFPTPILGYSINARDELYQFNITLQTSLLIGNLGLNFDFEGIAFNTDGYLYAVEDSNSDLYKIDPQTGVAEFVGSLGVNVYEMGLTPDLEGNLYMVGSGYLYSVDVQTGEATLIGDLGVFSIDSLAFDGTTLFGLSAVGQGRLYSISVDTGLAEFIGDVNGVSLTKQSGLTIDQTGNLWGLDEDGSIFSIDKVTAAVSNIFSIDNGFESLAIEVTVDSDGDGINDFWEIQYGLDPSDPSDAALDNDSDGLSNLQEFMLRTDPTSIDTDNDGLTDNEEVNTYSTQPTNADTDGDGMGDGWEVSYSLDPLFDDGSLDLDNDGFSNVLEFKLQTSPEDNTSQPELPLAIGYNYSDELVSVNLIDGSTSLLEAYNYQLDATGLDFNELEVLYAINDNSDSLIQFNYGLNSYSEVGNLNVYTYQPSFAIKDQNVAYMATNGWLYEVNLLSAETTEIGFFGEYETDSLVFDGVNLYAINSNSRPQLFMINVETGASTLIGDIDPYYLNYQSGLTIDGFGNLWAADSNGFVMLINKETAAIEYVVGTDSELTSLALFNIVDVDQDGMHDPWEILYGLNPNDASDGTSDLDGDGLLNYQEYSYRTNPDNSDSDSDGLTDGEEVSTYMSDPASSDTDDDSMHDGWEVSFGLDLLVDDAALDLDGDGISNILEFKLNTLPNDGTSVPTAPLAVAYTYNNELVELDLTSGEIENIQTFDYSLSLTGLDYSSDQVLFGMNDNNGSLIRFDQNNSTYEEIGSINNYVYQPSLAIIDNTTAIVASNGYLYDIDITTGAVSEIGTIPLYNTYSLAYDGENLYTINNEGDAALYIIDTATAETTLIGLIDSGYLSFESGLAVDQSGNLWAVDGSGNVVLINKETAKIDFAVQSDGQFRSLAYFRIEDSDQDGMHDPWELLYGLDPTNSVDGDTDLDGDGLVNLEEFINRTNPTLIDTDSDGLNDYEELLTYFTDPLVSDSDSDGLLDGAEVELQSNPLSEDTDGDEMHDGYEVENGLQVLVADGNSDLDADGYSNLQEFQYNTYAGIVTVSDLEPNDDFASAQNLDMLMTNRYSKNVGDNNRNTSESITYASILGTGNGTHDYYQFTIPQDNATVIIDIDYTNFDSYVRLYNEQEQLIFSNDDSSNLNGQEGSTSGLDSFLLLQSLSQGNYYLKVSRFPEQSIDTGATYLLNLSVEGASVIDWDQDGMTDSFEDQYGLNKNDAYDAFNDEDDDGLNNLAEYLHGSHPFMADSDDDGVEDSEDIAPMDSSTGSNDAPVFEGLEGISIEAAGMETEVELMPPTVTDNNVLSLTIASDYAGPLSIGEHVITWTATDQVGNQSSVEQTVVVSDTTPPTLDNFSDIDIHSENDLTNLLNYLSDVSYDLVDGNVAVSVSVEDYETTLLPTGMHSVEISAVDQYDNASSKVIAVAIHPQVELPTQTLGEPGSRLQLVPTLTGKPARLPLSVWYSVSGNGQEQIGQTTFDGESFTPIQIDLSQSLIAGDNLQVEMVSAENASVSPTHRSGLITIVEGNVLPQMRLVAYQQDKPVTFIARDLGTVTIEALVSDVNANDTHTVTNVSSRGGFIDLNDDGNPFSWEIDPQTLTGSMNMEVTIAENNTADQLATSNSITLLVVDSLPVLGSIDSDGDGLTDAQEGVFDDDEDGIPNYLDNNAIHSRLPLENSESMIKAAPGLHLSLGNVVRINSGMQAAGAVLDPDDIENAVNVLGLNTETTDLHYQATGKAFNFILSGLVSPAMSTVVVIPLDDSERINENSVLRKFSLDNGWQDFVIDGSNMIYSAVRSNDGVCPNYPTGFQEGLVSGAGCLALLIEDGGPNDADGMTNAQIEDPGVLTQFVNTAPISSIAEVSSIAEGTTFILNGSSSSDADGDMLTYSWSQISGPTVSFAGRTSESITLTAPQVSTDATMVFSLTVNDGFNDSSSQVSINVRNNATAPTPTNPNSGEGGGGSMPIGILMLTFMLMLFRLYGCRLHTKVN